MNSPYREEGSGRQDLPVELKLAKGQHAFDSHAKRDSLRAPVEVPECPPSLRGAALTEWREITHRLEQIGLVADLDGVGLRTWAENAADFQHWTRDIAIRGVVVPRPKNPGQPWQLRGRVSELWLAADKLTKLATNAFGITAKQRLKNGIVLPDSWRTYEPEPFEDQQEAMGERFDFMVAKQRRLQTFTPLDRIPLFVLAVLDVFSQVAYSQRGKGPVPAGEPRRAVYAYHKFMDLHDKLSGEYGMSAEARRLTKKQPLAPQAKPENGLKKFSADVGSGERPEFD